jgi:hypothetical protein
LESLAFDKNIFKDRAATEGNKKFMKNLKDITRDEIKISEIVKSFPIAEEVFLINCNWPYILNILKRKFGFNNPGISANEYNLEINEALETVQTGKPTSITVVAPSAPSAATSATPFATPSATPAATPSTGLLASLLGSTTTTAPPSTPGPAATVTSTTPSLMNDIPDATGVSSSFWLSHRDTKDWSALNMAGLSTAKTIERWLLPHQVTSSVDHVAELCSVIRRLVQATDTMSAALAWSAEEVRFSRLSESGIIPPYWVQEIRKAMADDDWR